MEILEHPYIDWALTSVSSVVIYFILDRYGYIPDTWSALYAYFVMWVIFFVLIFISIWLHYAFDVPTCTNLYLGIDNRRPASGAC